MTSLLYYAPKQGKNTRKMNPFLYSDAYKLSHHQMTPKGTTLIYSNMTPRSSRMGVDYAMWFGLQYACKEYLIKRFNRDFFQKEKGEVLAELEEVTTSLIGGMDLSHFAELHDLGYLPIKIKALPEGTQFPLRVPAMTIYNTHPGFAWLTNYLETLLSSILWMPSTSLTTAFMYRKVFEDFAQRTGVNDFVKFQGHDFSFRGMSSVESSLVSSMAFLTAFSGTDSVHALQGLKEYYNADLSQEVGCSVPASEHSLQCLYTFLSEEFDYYDNIITDIHPSGFVSLVADGFDYFNVLTNFLPRLKDKILSRDGRVVIRPDSSPKTPLEIICGDPEATTEPERKGSLELLWDTFGGTINSKGCRELDPHIGLIYGEAITPEMQFKILTKMEEMGFASSNVVMGLGSFGFQYKTRDSLGWAIKATYAENNGKGIPIFKDPKTDNGMKKSATGLLRVNDDLTLSENVSWEEEAGGLLETVFENGELKREHTLLEIRERVMSYV